MGIRAPSPCLRAILQVGRITSGKSYLEPFLYQASPVLGVTRPAWGHGSWPHCWTQSCHTLPAAPVSPASSSFPQGWSPSRAQALGRTGPQAGLISGQSHAGVQDGERARCASGHHYASKEFPSHGKHAGPLLPWHPVALHSPAWAPHGRAHSLIRVHLWPSALRPGTGSAQGTAQPISALY